MGYHKIVLCFAFAGLLSACHKDKSESIPALSYADEYNWAALPDSIMMDVDVFYVYPTLFSGTEEMNMDISDDAMRSRVQTVMPKQAGVFYADCNVFTPYYRQMSLDGLALQSSEREPYLSIGVDDVEQAFDYYMTHFNAGRPFILAGHSQGSLVLIRLLKDAFNDVERKNKLVTAYLIGYTVTNSDLSACGLELATSAQQTGAIITYNTQSEDATGSPVLLDGALCVNPLSWTNTSEVAPKERNLGAVFFTDTGDVDSIVPHFTNAWIDANGALVAGNVEVETYSDAYFPEGVFHKFDYSFFYNNLVENVGVRINAYQQKRKNDL